MITPQKYNDVFFVTKDTMTVIRVGREAASYIKNVYGPYEDELEAHRNLAKKIESDLAYFKWAYKDVDIEISSVYEAVETICYELEDTYRLRIMKQLDRLNDVTNQVNGSDYKVHF